MAKNYGVAASMEIEKLTKKLEQVEEQKAMKPFVRGLLENIGTLLAATPFEQWPNMAKVAYLHTAKDIPTAAYFYKKNLPK